MQLLSDTKLITCIMPKGHAFPLQEALAEEKGIHSGTFHHGRGVGREANIQDRGIGEQPEREVIEVVVEAAIAEEIFDFMYSRAELDQPHGGIIYMTSSPRATTMLLPEVEEE